MAEQDRSTSFVPILLVFTLIGGVGGGLYLYEPYESSRPKETTVEISATADPEFVPARVWQDPFNAIRRCQQGRSTYENAECAPKNDYPSWPHSLAKDKPSELVIMPIMVYGGTYSEDVENRRRRRYAIISAMAMRDYQLHDAENIGYFKFPSRHSSDKESFVVPYEWFQHNTAHYVSSHKLSKNFPPVLLLWIDERHLRYEPLKKTYALIKKIENKLALNNHGQKTTATIIGPAGSASLRSMVKEAYSLAKYESINYADICPLPDKNTDNITNSFKNWNLSIFSPTATASARIILGETENKIRQLYSFDKKQECDDITDCRNIYNDGKYTSLFLIEKIFNEIGIQFFRTTTSDRALAHTLIDKEFKHRKIKLSTEQIMVLISEWDTFYGRALPEVFSKSNEENTRRYFYMRGLDGEIIPAIDETQTNEANLSIYEKPQERNLRSLERAVGVNRFDYLRRLGQKINDDLKNESVEVRAIGVLGSDVYDKLLVLQALRQNFPKALFFTTDSDARFLHPAEFKWTRNLVVLSGYGLEVSNPELIQHLISVHNFDVNYQLPTFRDSYQTAMFLATQLAMTRSLRATHDESSKINRDRALRKCLVSYFSTPKIYEVARTGFVPLGGKPWSFSTWWTSTNKYLLFSFLFLTLMLVYIKLFHNHSRHVVSSITVVLLAAIISIVIPYWIYYCLDGKTGEPLPVLSGANSLPTISILLLAIISAIYFIARTQTDIKKNAREITEKFKLPRPANINLLSSRIKKLAFMRRVIWRLRICCGCDFLSRFQRRHQTFGTEFVWIQYLRSIRYPFQGAQLKYDWLRFVLASCPNLRLVSVAIIHTIFAVVLVLIVDDPKPPIRGLHTLNFYVACTFFSFLFFFMLLYVVIDQLRMCCALARLSTQNKLTWPKITLEKFSEPYGIILDNSGKTSTKSSQWMKYGIMKWLLIQLLAERTQVIEKSVYYPFVILLMLIVARSTLFDNWQFLPSIIIIIVTSILIIVAWAVLLRGSVKQARETALISMRECLSQGLNLTDNKTEIEQFQLLIENVKNERRGAFRSFASDPIFKALLMPSGGYGGLLLLEYFAN